ncbi:MAG: lytic transglycosylase domain-containing protein [Marmoricola sp.]
MKSLWALLSTLALSTAVVATGVAAVAATTPETGVLESAEASADPSSSLVPSLAAHGFFWQLTAPQAVVPGTVLMSQKDRHKRAHGTRSDHQFYEISSTGSNDVPEAALRAYRHAEMVMAKSDPGCNISWTLLAAIGRVESNHGRFAGAQLGSDGVSRPEIRGPQLNGAGPFAAIHDSDNGTLDHDLVWDRAVGQMQFLPQTWRAVARDGDGDAKMNPDDIDDSALGSAVYLCGAGGSLADPAGMSRAAFRYNHSDYYVQLVLSFVSGYQTGVFALPSPPPPPAARTRSQGRAKQPVTKKHITKQHTANKPAPRPTKPTPTPVPKPTPTPSPTPTPTPKPTPTGPKLVTVTGTWTACGASFCLGGTALDLGTASTLGDRASSDYDGDGSQESNADEFSGLVGKHATLQVERNVGGFVVYLINAKGYRNADGSFARAAAASMASPTATP